MVDLVQEQDIRNHTDKFFYHINKFLLRYINMLNLYATNKTMI